MSAKTEKPVDDDLTRFKRDIDTDAAVTVEQRIAANEDMRFIHVIGGMWDSLTSTGDTSDRIRLELDMISGPLNRYIGGWNQNRVGVDYKSDDDNTTPDNVDLMNGIYRADFRDNSGKVATDNAVNECATCGFGAFKMKTRFVDDNDPENEDQQIEWEPIHSAFNTVIWDQASQRIDKRDARHCTLLEQFTRESFEQEFPGKDPVSAHVPSTELDRSAVRHTDVVFVATRYEVVKKPQTVFIYNDLKSGEVEVYNKDDHELIKGELKSNQFKTFVRERNITTQIVEKTVFSGAEILEKTRRIVGKWIPIVPMYAFRGYVDGQEWYRGLVRKLKDPQMAWNTQVSQVMENAGSHGQEVPIFAPDQMIGDGIKDLWANKNNVPYLLAHPLLDKEGNVLLTGPLGFSKPAQLDQSSASVLGLMPDFIRDQTGSVITESVRNDMSGKAIKAIIKREDLKTQVVNDNIEMAITWSGEIYQAMASEVYTTRRMINTLSADGTDAKAQIQKLEVEEKTGKIITVNTLRGKRFRVYADVGPQYETVKEETVENMKGLVEAFAQVPSAQEYIPVILSVMIENSAGSGMKELKEFNRRKMLALGIVEPETEEEEELVRAMQQPKENPQAKLIEAAAEQQTAEAESLRASSQQKLADAGKKRAETAEIVKDIGLGDRKMLATQQSERQKAVFANQNQATGVQ